MPKNLYQRNGVWYARFSAGSELRRICLRTGDLRLAKTRLKALQTKTADAQFGIREARGWPEAVTSYVNGALQSGAVKANTAKRYLVSLRQIAPYFNTLTLADINEAQIAQFVSARQTEGATNATIRRDLTTISRVLAHARAQGATSTNAALAYDRSLIRERRPPIHAPADAAIKACAVALPAQWAAFIRWLRATGMRLGESLRADWSHLDGDGLTIPETKSGKVRTIRVSPDVLPDGERKGRIFAALSPDSGTVSSQFAHFRRKFPSLPRFRLHDLRHAYAISQIRDGRDIYDLSHHLGHSSVKVTEIYLGYAASSRSASRKMQGGTEMSTSDSASDTKNR